MQRCPCIPGAMVQTATGAPDQEIVLGIQELPASQAMEMGQIMPEVTSRIEGV